MGKYSWAAIANFFIKKDLKTNETNDKALGIHVLSLHGLVYLAHAWSMAKRDVVLVAEPFTASRKKNYYFFFPVVDEMFDLQVERYKRQSLYVEDYVGGVGVNYPLPKDEEDVQFLNQVWDAYKHFGPYDFRFLEKIYNSPYMRFKQPGENIVVPNSAIKNFYANLTPEEAKRAIIPLL